MKYLKKIRIRLPNVLTRSLKPSVIMLVFLSLNIEKLKSEPNQVSEPNQENVSADSAALQKHYRVLAVGDVMLGSDWPIPVMDPRVSADAKPSAVLGKPLASLFTDADIVFGNLVYLFL
jgi:hypothetical protein